MTETTTAIDKALQLLIEYGIIGEGSDRDQQILIGVTNLLNLMVLNNRRIISQKDQIFRLEAVLDSAGIIANHGERMN